MKKMIPLLFSVLLLGALGRADAPPSNAAGKIEGTLESSQKILRIAAVDRTFADVLKTSQKNPKDPFLYQGTLADNGKFTIDKLIPGHTYDLIVWTQNSNGDTTRWEGIDMAYHRDINPSTPLTDADRTWLENFVKDMPSFYDKSRVLHMAADHKHATLLVELARTRDFHSDKGGEVIYRVELWYFENLFGGWAKDKNTEKVMVRWRGDGKQIEKNWQFIPDLGGIAPGAKVDLKLPGAADGKIGLAGGMQ